MPTYLPFVILGVVALALLMWKVVAQRGKGQRQKAALEQLGFRPCADRKDWLEETITRIENNRGFRYEVRDPQCLGEEPTVYHYTKVRYSDDPEETLPLSEEEILFPLRRPVAGGLFLIVKPSSLSPGLATSLVGAVATAPWDAQPDDLRKFEIPPALKNTNLVGALGPPGAGLYDVVDSGTLSVVQGLGDAGGLLVRFRDSWCSVASAGEPIPFRLDELVARIRPLL